MKLEAVAKVVKIEIFWCHKGTAPLGNRCFASGAALRCAAGGAVLQRWKAARHL